MADKVKVLNVGEILDKDESRSAVALSKVLQKIMLKMKGSFMSVDGRGVDYTALKNSKLFEEFQKSTRYLQQAQLSGLTPSEKTAFFLNIYNALTIHGLAECHLLPMSVLEISNFWRHNAYCIGGYTLSLDDIEHGILRGNRPHPSSSTSIFPEGDPRCELVLSQVDPRIHFALVCGAKSCPAINVYSEDNLQQGLSAAARSFCSQEVEIDNKEVTLSKIFIWYKQDFGSSDIALLRWISQYLPPDRELQMKEITKRIESGEKVVIKVKDYNWNLNKL